MRPIGSAARRWSSKSMGMCQLAVPQKSDSRPLCAVLSASCNLTQSTVRVWATATICYHLRRFLSAIWAFEMPQLALTPEQRKRQVELRKGSVRETSAIAQLRACAGRCFSLQYASLIRAVRRVA